MSTLYQVIASGHGDDAPVSHWLTREQAEQHAKELATIGEVPAVVRKQKVAGDMSEVICFTVWELIIGKPPVDLCRFSVRDYASKRDQFTVVG